MLPDKAIMTCLKIHNDSLEEGLGMHQPSSPTRPLHFTQIVNKRWGGTLKVFLIQGNPFILRPRATDDLGVACHTGVVIIEPLLSRDDERTYISSLPPLTKGFMQELLHHTTPSVVGMCTGSKDIVRWI